MSTPETMLFPYTQVYLEAHEALRNSIPKQATFLDYAEYHEASANLINAQYPKGAFSELVKAHLICAGEYRRMAEEVEK